ncbi:hypothetical protein SGLAM104S_05627 [Streptomyces glaucescens]
MLTVVSFRPEGSVYVVLVMPRSFAVAFIFATKSFSAPASQRASSRATLFADAMRMLSRASRSEIRSPAKTSTVDSWPASDCSSAAWSILIIGPSSPLFSGCSRRITYAVMTLATLAIGTGFCSPDEPNVPMPWTSRAAWPSCGHGIPALEPSKV